jgi:hypothetical protein
LVDDRQPFKAIRATSRCWDRIPRRSSAEEEDRIRRVSASAFLSLVGIAYHVIAGPPLVPGVAEIRRDPA